MKVKLFFLMLVLLTHVISGQTTIVSYQFNNNLTPDNGAVGSPVLGYFDAANNVKTPLYNANMLSTDDQGDYLELSVNADGFQSMVLSFYGDFAALFIAA